MCWNPYSCDKNVVTSRCEKITKIKSKIKSGKKLNRDHTWSITVGTIRVASNGPNCLDHVTIRHGSILALRQAAFNIH